jgi:hypothetical protein
MFISTGLIFIMKLIAYLRVSTGGQELNNGVPLDIV